MDDIDEHKKNTEDLWYDDWQKGQKSSQYREEVQYDASGAAKPKRAVRPAALRGWRAAPVGGLTDASWHRPRHRSR
jgi:hypothetical protein